MHKAPRPDLVWKDQFWVDSSFSEVVPPHPKESREKFYAFVIRAFKRLMKFQRLQLIVEGADKIPASGGAVLACNHTGYFDFVYCGISAYTRGHRLVRYMAKKEIFDVRGVNKLMNAMGHIPVDRAAGSAALDEAITAAKSGKLLGIFPEGTISRSFEVAKELRTGAVRIAQGADVPLIPVVMWGSQRVWSKGVPKNLGRSGTPIWIRVCDPIDITGDLDAATAQLREVLQSEVEKLRAEYEDAFGPFEGGEPWRPKSLGGGAPSLEEAEEIAAAERQARLEKKAAADAQREAKSSRVQSWWRKLKK